MAKIGRNQPCYCGSGMKYKHCHSSFDQQQETEQRRLRRAPDTLLPKLIEATQAPEIAIAVPQALERYWDGKYEVADLEELDDHEDRGSDRFLNWFAFDYVHEDGRTLVERITADPESVELDSYEQQLLSQWADVRLRPYRISEIKQGQGFTVSDLLTGAEYEVEDHAASKRVELEEVVLTHLVPAGGRYYVAGAAAHLTPDTQEKLREYIDIQRQATDNTDDAQSFVRSNSHLFNHFVMALPREEGEPSRIDDLLLQGRASLQLAAESLGLHHANTDEQPDESQEQGEDEPADEAARNVEAESTPE